MAHVVQTTQNLSFHMVTCCLADGTAKKCTKSYHVRIQLLVLLIKYLVQLRSRWRRGFLSSPLQELRDLNWLTCLRNIVFKTRSRQHQRTESNIHDQLNC